MLLTAGESISNSPLALAPLICNRAAGDAIPIPIYPLPLTDKMEEDEGDAICSNDCALAPLINNLAGGAEPVPIPKLPERSITLNLVPPNSQL